MWFVSLANYQLSAAVLYLKKKKATPELAHMHTRQCHRKLTIEKSLNAVQKLDSMNSAVQRLTRITYTNKGQSILNKCIALYSKESLVQFHNITQYKLRHFSTVPVTIK